MIIICYITLLIYQTIFNFLKFNNSFFIFLNKLRNLSSQNSPEEYLEFSLMDFMQQLINLSNEKNILKIQSIIQIILIQKNFNQFCLFVFFVFIIVFLFLTQKEIFYFVNYLLLYIFKRNFCNIYFVYFQIALNRIQTNKYIGRYINKILQQKQEINQPISNNLSLQNFQINLNFLLEKFFNAEGIQVTHYLQISKQAGDASEIIKQYQKMIFLLSQRNQLQKQSSLILIKTQQNQISHCNYCMKRLIRELEFFSQQQETYKVKVFPQQDDLAQNLFQHISYCNVNSQEVEFAWKISRQLYLNMAAIFNSISEQMIFPNSIDTQQSNLEAEMNQSQSTKNSFLINK
ncbi:transmembrane protein, putative (macronuclear) [Tetrahymena thermophila SB210]|uniref:Transmembrane protein, putative n=1 Tax=Tetrahymena thermophila (strain SB210) TaxID=312017 RepID=Q22WX6_TETTS|nr:transmembrane protein, putative [Tetrahymena thermophila SB210]EAR89870.2 transmembrane protein, putative [Tetrahymena thermophila SB210]|eukprot:XP_001010115.2 transmembrane protein, putative [Tetrahymena thermophila SB210]